MHDLGNVETYRAEKRVRGGTYWGIPSEQVRDIAAWIDFAEGLGFKRIVLVGHSAGANAVREYQAQTHDPRVAGLILASGDVRPEYQTSTSRMGIDSKAGYCRWATGRVGAGSLSECLHILGHRE